jgi:hypothetical protein
VRKLFEKINFEKIRGEHLGRFNVRKGRYGRQKREKRFHRELRAISRRGCEDGRQRRENLINRQCGCFGERGVEYERHCSEKNLIDNVNDDWV